VALFLRHLDDAGADETRRACEADFHFFPNPNLNRNPNPIQQD
jgi:hypothetical protein